MTDADDDARKVLAVIAGRLDDARDLIEVATTHLRDLGVRVTRHEATINDLHWDAARILLGGSPDEVTGASGQRVLRAVRLGTGELAQDIRRSAATAGATHELLTRAGHEMTVVDRLIGEVSLPAAAAGDVSGLAGRTERLSTLLEVATPLVERVQRQLAEARSLLEQQVSARPDLDRFQQFWSLDVGIFDGSRAVAQARAGVRDGSELAERAAYAGTVTSMQLRDLRHQHTHQHTHRPPPPSVGPVAPAGPAI